MKNPVLIPPTQRQTRGGPPDEEGKGKRIRAGLNLTNIILVFLFSHRIPEKPHHSRMGSRRRENSIQVDPGGRTSVLAGAPHPSPRILPA
jgi:hypothetical protein